MSYDLPSPITRHQGLRLVKTNSDAKVFVQTPGAEVNNLLVYPRHRSCEGEGTHERQMTFGNKIIKLSGFCLDAGVMTVIRAKDRTAWRCRQNFTKNDKGLTDT